MNMPISTERGALVCPFCGEENLHHGGVLIFERQEDNEKVRISQVHSGEVSVEFAADNETSGNPSSRRGGIRVGFYCENCSDGKHLSLCIFQHKGMTFIEWCDQ